MQRCSPRGSGPCGPWHLEEPCLSLKAPQWVACLALGSLRAQNLTQAWLLLPTGGLSGSLGAT